MEAVAPEGGSLEAFHKGHRSNNQGVVEVRIPGTPLEEHSPRIDKDCIQGEASVGTVEWGMVEELRTREPSEVRRG